MAALDHAAAPALRDPDRAFVGHPGGLAYLAFMEAFERFSFYGMQALLVLYMTNRLLLPGHVEQVAGFAPFRAAIEGWFGPLRPQALSSEIFGLYAGFCSFTPVFGGLIGDRWLGQRRAVLVGGALMAAGHFLMAFEASFLVALALLIAGVGLLKGNVSAQVGNLYVAGDRRREAAFQIFYLGAQLGVLAAPLVCGTLGELVGWHWGFGAAGVAMLASLAIYVGGWRWLPPDTMARTGGAPAKLARTDLPVLAALGVLLVVVALFWIANGETLNAVILWAKGHLDRQVGPLEMPASWMTAIQSAIGISMAPLLIRLWDRQAARGREPTALGKMAIGCGFAAAGYAVLALACALSGPALVPLAWVFGFYLLAQTGYLFVYPIGMALFSRAAPPAINSLMIGIYFMSVFAGSLLVGWVGQSYERMAAPAFWLIHAGAAAGAGLIVLVLWRPLSRALEARPQNPS